MILQKNHELRFEGKTAQITILKGHVEHKGMELLLDKEYKFTNTNSFLYAHTDSEVKIEGENENYISSNSNTLEILKFFENILRNDVNTFLVIGKGKCTFIQTIANYLLRFEKNVLISELNPATGFITFPGCIGSFTNNNLIDNTNMNISNPLIYFFGSSNIETNVDYYKLLLEILDKAVLKKNFDFHFVIANEEILNIIDEKEFKGFDGTVVVLKEEKLFNKIKGRKVLINGGTYEEIDKFAKINSFFNGLNETVTSFSVKLSRSKCRIVRIGEEFVAPETALPLGAERKIKRDIVVEVEPRIGAVLGVSFANNDEEVGEMPVKSFVILDQVHEKYFKVLSPQPNLKCNFLLQGEINNKI
ncbi:Cleavage polyadenylation factor subunit clp1 [Gurleya vavrai]